MIRSVAISCYDLSRHIEDAIEKLLPAGNRVIGVNDCSQDDAGLPGLYKENKKVIFIAPVLNQDRRSAMITGAYFFINELTNEIKIARVKDTL